MVKTAEETRLIDEAFGTRASLIILRLGLVALASLLAAAFTQRLLLARFFSKVGPGGIELEPLTEATATMDERLTALEEGAKKTREAIRRLTAEKRKENR